MSDSCRSSSAPTGRLGGMHEDTQACVRAVQAKDPRFDGWFFTAVLTTGIYCRPSCPVVPPKPQNMRFYPSAAAAQRGGFRACKRCRPDASPGSPEWSTRTDVTARAMRLVADGVVDREGVAGLARRLGYSTRQVERLLSAELGAGPLALARAQRAQTARTLIESSDLPMTDVAFAAGFSSLRSFNATIQAVFALTPSELRRRAGGRCRPAGERPAGQRGTTSRCACRSGRRCCPTACSGIWSRRACPRWRSGVLGPTAAPSGWPTAQRSSPSPRTPTT
jgi:AraC family transcriptional regulator of adaptative response / DNA-3-methyladenine glycosylase II